MSNAAEQGYKNWLNSLSEEEKKLYFPPQEKIETITLDYLVGKKIKAIYLDMWRMVFEIEGSKYLYLTIGKTTDSNACFHGFHNVGNILNKVIDGVILLKINKETIYGCKIIAGSEFAIFNLFDEETDYYGGKLDTPTLIDTNILQTNHARRNT